MSCGAVGRLAPGRHTPVTATPRRCGRSMPAFSAIRASSRRSCRSATGCSSPRGAADALVSIAVHVRLFAIQRELAGTRNVTLELADDADVEAAWSALADRYPVLAPGRASLRFARNGDYAEPTTRLVDGDEVAMIPPVSGGSDRALDEAVDGPNGPDRRRILELRSEPFDVGIVTELADALAVDLDGAVVGFVGRTRSTPGTPAPGQEAEAARHAGRSVDAL